jgi:hypothetical protein
MFNIKEYNQLSNTSNKDKPFVSIYIGTGRVGEAEQYQLKFKNQLKDSLTQLTDESMMGNRVMSKDDAQKFLSKAYQLLEDDVFWSHLSDGLAVFISSDSFYKYTVPLAFNDFTYVGEKYYLRHLLPMLTDDNRFFVLALSQNEIRFFEGHKNSITPVKIKDLVPMNIGELIGMDDREKVVQHHNGGSDTIYHGQGGAKDAKKIEVEKYFKDIDDGLMKMLYDEKAPLIVYSTEGQAALYKRISNYSNVFDGEIIGNPENDDPVLIHEKAWNKLRVYFSENRKKLQERFEQALVEDNASFSIHQVVPATINGRVDTLYVDENTEAVWGAFDKETNTITIHNEYQKDSICLLNEAATTTFKNGGQVLNIPRMEFPRIVAQVNAIYRF